MFHARTTAFIDPKSRVKSRTWNGVPLKLSLNTSEPDTNSRRYKPSRNSAALGLQHVLEN